MNYRLHYDRLIERGRHREIDGYTEGHHVLPKCQGGSDDASNIVRLTPEEHYVAHQLLVKMYPLHYGLLWAAIGMACKNKSGFRNNKIYGWLRRRVSQQMRGRKHSAEARAKIGAASAARVRLPETNRKIGEAQRGKIISLEQRAKISASLRGKTQSDGTIAKRVAKLTGRKNTPEQRAKMSAAQSGRVHSLETREKISAAKRGQGKGRMVTSEQRENYRAAWVVRKAKRAAALAQNVGS